MLFSVKRILKLLTNYDSSILSERVPYINYYRGKIIFINRTWICIKNIDAAYLEHRPNIIISIKYITANILRVINQMIICSKYWYTQRKIHSYYVVHHTIQNISMAITLVSGMGSSYRDTMIPQFGNCSFFFNLNWVSP